MGATESDTPWEVGLNQKFREGLPSQQESMIFHMPGTETETRKLENVAELKWNQILEYFGFVCSLD